MIIHGEFQQKNGGDATEQWSKIRLGKITASEAKRFVQLDGKLRKGDMPRTYLCEKLFERWTGRSKPSGWISMPVNNGVIVETKAALFAEMKYGLEIQSVGFVSDDQEQCGMSPDGLINFPGIKPDAPTLYGQPSKSSSGIEIKSPNLDTHINWLLDGELPEEHRCQVMASMFFTGCQTWHFLSYPLACYLDGFPPLHLVIERDEKWQANFADALDEFMEKFNSEWKKLCELNGGPPARIATAQESHPDDENPDVIP